MLSIDEYIKALLDTPFEKTVELLGSMETKLEELKKQRPEQLNGFKDYLNKLTKVKLGVESFKFELNLDVILQYITDQLLGEQEEWTNKRIQAVSVIDEEIEALKSKIENDNKVHNETLRQQNKTSNVGFDMLESKRKILEGYSDKIFDMCNQYDITSSDIDIDETLFTPDELNKLYDEYIKFMEKELNGSNIISKFRNAFPDTTVQGIAIIIFIVLCISPILDIVSIAFFILLGVNQIQNINRSKYYSVLMAITFNIRPENMGYTQLDESLLLPEELTMEMLDEDERFSGFEEKYDAVDKQFEEINPETASVKLISEWSEKLPENQKHLKELEDIYNNKIREIVENIVKEIESAKEEYDRLISEYKFIGARYSNHVTFDGTFALGIHDDCIEETIDVGQRNIIIRPSIDSNMMYKFLQALYVNAISNVMPGKLKVIVYDPNDFGRSIMPLYKDELRFNLEFYNDKLNEVIDELVDYVQNNFKEMQGKTIEEYNANCEKVGITPIEYRILMILSQPKTIEEDEKLQNLFEYSATGGVFIWVVSDNMQSKNAFVFRRPFEGVENPIVDRVTPEWCSQVAQNYIEAIANAKPKGLLWQDFIDNVWPYSKTWEGDATTFIDFYPGYHEGDPTLYKPYTLGNEGNVHAIGVGTSGAGKSVFLNHLINTMCIKYSPLQLELWLCDFKGVEFKAYMNLPRPKAARLCKPEKVAEGETPGTGDEKQRLVFGYYKYNPETQEYTFSAEPTDDCKELCKFTQKMDGNKNNPQPKKKKDGTEVDPLPKADMSYEPNIEVYSLPHIAACLCTSDGDYATSLFHAFRTKADRRYEDMKFVGVKNMPGWNAKIKGMIGQRKPEDMITLHTKDYKETDFNPIWTEKDLWTRVLFVCDEFQVIFQKADPKNVDKIKADITQIAKVARACGMHIFFTSQSMKGTISSDILANFTLRFALRCEAEVSRDIIGSTRAAEIKEKNGYLIVQSQEMKTAEDQKRYKTPFLCDDPGSGKLTESELFDNIRYLSNLAVERNIPPRDVISYEEATKHPIEQLTDLYKELGEQNKLPEYGLFFLGPRMAYSNNKAPDNIILNNKNNTHIMSVASDYNDYVLFFQSLMTNIKSNKNPGTVIINSQIEDISYLCDIDKYITYPDKHDKLKSVSPKEMITWAGKLVEARKNSGKKDSPVWMFFLGWDKGKGIGVDTDVALRTTMNNLLQTCGELNVHVIFMNTTMSGIALATINACKYRIAAKCSVDDSMSCIGTKQAGVVYEGMANGWIFSLHDGEITRDKLYISPIEREIQVNEVVL